MATFQPSGESPQYAIDLDFDEPVFSLGEQRVVDIERQIHAYRPKPRNSSLRTDISGFDEQTEEEIASEELANFIDLTVDDDPVVTVRSQRRRRDPTPRAPERKHEKVKIAGGLSIKLNTLYELSHYRDSSKKRERKANHWSLERIRAHEVIRDEFRVPEEVLKEDWRGQTIPGGSKTPETGGFVSSSSLTASKQQYTVFDSFCGAGGFSRGAERALRNVDILHLSPPCQTWSPAHTVPGANDEANIAALFACRSLVEKVRPRIFTLEQTFGIMQPCFDPFFCSLVGGFTEFGYSVTWKIVHLQNWGLPQTRKRLIMIGACPGEKLPPFPSATHSETGGRGLSKYVTIRQALAKINVTSTFHNPEEEVKDTLPLGSVISDPDQILRRCVTCSGGQNMHWSNTRSYTVREFASLQGFPVWHQFADAPKSALKKQIGNAFPACVVRLLYEHLKNWLLVEDGLAPARELRGSVGGRELVFVSEGPCRETPPSAPVPVGGELGGSHEDAIMLDDDDGMQVDIKYDEVFDVDMTDVPEAPNTPGTFDAPNTPNTPDTPYTPRSRSRSRTLSFGATPSPTPAVGSKDSPIMFD